MNPSSDPGAQGGAPLDVRPPEDELRAVVQARMEALAKLGTNTAAPAGSSAGRLELYAKALERGLARLKEARA